MGSLREVGEEKAGDGIPNGAGAGRNRKKVLQHLAIKIWLAVCAGKMKQIFATHAVKIGLSCLLRIACCYSK